MGYKNGKDIFPPELLNELQKYVQGDLIYIPRKSELRAGWGELSGTKSYMRKRNIEIYSMYKQGLSVDELVKIYHLSCDSIRKIVCKISRTE